MKWIRSQRFCQHAFNVQIFWRAFWALAVCLYSMSAEAKTTSSTNNGTWFRSNPPLTWNNGVPAAGDIVNMTNTVTLNTNAGVIVSVGQLNIQPGGFLSFNNFIPSLNPVVAVSGAGSMWSAGAFGGGTVIMTGSVTISSTSTNPIEVGTITNLGTINHMGAANLGMAPNTWVLNTASGTYDIQSDVGITNFSNVSPAEYFENDGLLRKSGGSGNSIVVVPFNNVGGTIQVLTGQITLGSPSGGASVNGVFNVSAGAVLDLTGGFDPFYSGVFTGSGAGQVQVNSGALGINTPCTFNFPSNLFQWNGGSIGGGTLTNLGTMTLASTNSKTLTGVGILVNPGQVIVTGTGPFSDGGFFQNLVGGLFDFQNDAAISASGLGTFENDGLMRKSSGSGTSSVAVPFTNTGTVEARSGTLSFTGAYTQTAGVTSLNGGALIFSAGLNLQGGSLIGSGQITGNVASGGIVSPGFSVGAIQINGNYTQNAGGAFNVELAGRTPSQFDQLNVTGSAALNGALNVSLLPGFTPASGDAYEILSCSNLIGSFSATNGLPVGMMVDYRTNGVFLIVTTSSSPIIIQPILKGTNFTFGFNSIAGITYTVQSSTNLLTTNWIALQVITGDGSFKAVATPVTTNSKKFFRVLQQ
jgi:hypothetical protein